MKRIIGLMAVGILAGVPFYGVAATQHDVVINEMAWMGSTTSPYNEWIELFNTTHNPIDTTNWKITSADGKLKITLKGTIGTQGFYLVARDYKTSGLVVKPDVLYKGNLANGGMNLLMYDATGILVDQVNASNGWLAGDNATKQTMERTSAGLWQTSTTANGTPRADNSMGMAKEIIPSTPSLAPAQKALPKVKKSANNNAVSLQRKPEPTTQTAAVVLPVSDSVEPKPSETPNTSPSILFVVSGAVLILCGAGALGYYFIHKRISHTHERP